MHVILYYAGLRRRAYVTNWLTHHGETYCEAIIDGFKIIKTVHASAIRQQNVAI